MLVALLSFLAMIVGAPTAQSADDNDWEWTKELFPSSDISEPLPRRDSRLRILEGPAVGYATAEPPSNETNIHERPAPIDFRLISDGKYPVYELRGLIGFDSEERVLQVIGSRKGGWLHLRSEGGSLASAMAVGRAIRRAGVNTYVPAGQRCYSGCAIIWVAGVERWVGKRGIVGFHRPWFMENGQMIYGDTSDLVAYFQELGFNSTAIGKFLWPSEGLFFLTRRQALALGVEARFEH